MSFRVGSAMSRRRFFAGCSTAAVARILAPGMAHASNLSARGVALPVSGGVSDVLATRMDAPTVKELALRAIESAKAAGATYADVRLTRTVNFYVFDDTKIVEDWEQLAVGVRALVNGYWGFASSPYWRLEEMHTLVQSAVAIAKTNALGSPRTVDWQPVPIVTGDWSTPIEIDPFTVPIEEMQDLIGAFSAYTERYYLPAPTKQLRARFGISCFRQERALATSEGSYVTQTIHNTVAWPDFISFGDTTEKIDAKLRLDGLHLSSRGWELIRDAKLIEQIPRIVDRLEALARVPKRSCDFGRYDIVVDASTTAMLLDRTLGRATELDRALGYEANAGGTSYLGPNPLALLGKYQVGSPLLNVTADRSMPHGGATVKWDDEGVVPDTAVLIKNGILNDYQTTREQAGWLAPWYQKAGMPVRSHGFAASQSAIAVTIQHPPNFVMAPGSEDTSVEDLIRNVKNGLYIQNGVVRTDYQAKTGILSDGVYGTTREIVNGKLGDVRTDGEVLFNASELWKSLTAIGGDRSTQTVDFGNVVSDPLEDQKGQPLQVAPTRRSVRAVPALFKNVVVARS